MIVFLQCLLAFAFLGQGQQAAERAQLTEGVGDMVSQGGVPGAMVASGSPAFVVLTGQSGDVLAPLFVATHVGKGRALAGGHDCFFGERQMKNENNRKFFINTLTWLGAKPLTSLTVGFLGTAAPSEVLTKEGVHQLDLSKANLAERLKSVDVLCLGQGALDGDLSAQALVLQYLKDGGGLEISGPAWGWEQLNRGRSLLNYHSGNRLLGDFGIHFTGGTVSETFSSDGAGDPSLTTFGAMGLLQQPGVTPAQVRSGIGSIDRALELEQPGDNSLTSQIEAMAKKEGNGMPMPTLKNPITWATPFSRLQARLAVRQWQNAPPQAITKDPTADAFPGEIPVGAKRVSKQVAIDTSVGGWHALGLYAAPGEMVTVTILESARNAGLSVRIGPHTDSLWHLDSWQRFPEISQLSNLSSVETKMTSPFGGLIYVVVPPGCELGQTPVKVSHAVASPLFELGKTTKLEWEDSQLTPAPWADLEGKHVSISLPHSAIQSLKDPTALMRYWDEVFQNCCDLYQVPMGNRQERYCVDRQIGGGYMHSGYPIMTWEDVANTFADLSKLTSNGGHTWGFYHEMGHNFQQPDWTFEGTGEVTNNLFSVYGNEMLNGITPGTYGKAHPAIEPNAMRERIAKYVAGGAKFSQWKEDPFLALSMYLQLRIAFGWDPFKHVFAEYRGLPREERPKSDLDKHDQWMVRFSRTVRKNLGPFFQAWGVPTSEAARQSIEGLPSWMPADWPKA